MKTLLFGLMTCCLVLAETSSAMPIFMDGYPGVDFTMEALVEASKEEIYETMKYRVRGNVEEGFTTLLLEQPTSPNDEGFIISPKHLKIYEELLAQQPYYPVPWIGAYLIKSKFFAESPEWQPFSRLEWTSKFSKEQLALARLRAEKVLISLAEFNMRDLSAAPDSARKRIIQNNFIAGDIHDSVLAELLSTLPDSYDKADFVVPAEHLKIYQDIWNQTPPKAKRFTYAHMFYEYLHNYYEYAEGKTDAKNWTGLFTQEQHKLIINRALKIHGAAAIDAQRSAKTKDCQPLLVQQGSDEIGKN